MRPPLDAASSRAVRADPAPVVDVGIPTCGRPSYLVEAVESVLAQALPEWRLTVSEDGPGSDAVAAAVAPHLSNARVRYVVTGQRLGAARPMSRLIRTGTARETAASAARRAARVFRAAVLMTIPPGAARIALAPELVPRLRDIAPVGREGLALVRDVVRRSPGRTPMSSLRVSNP